MGLNRSKMPKPSYLKLNLRLIKRLERETQRLNRSFGRNQIVAHHKSFFKQFPSGVISREEFDRNFSLKNSFNEILFNAHDRDSSGNIDFGEYIIVQAVMHPDTDRFIKAEWYLRTIYDLNGDGELEMSEIKSVLIAIYEHISEYPVEREKFEASANYYTNQIFKICFEEVCSSRQTDKISIDQLMSKCRQNPLLYEFLTAFKPISSVNYAELNGELLNKLAEEASKINGNLGESMIQELHGEFFSLYPDGVMDKMQFNDNLELTDWFTDLMLKTYDLDKNGYIDFREYVLFKAIVREDTDKYKKIEWIMKTYDLNEDGELERGEVHDALATFYEHVNQSFAGTRSLEDLAAHNTEEIFKAFFGADNAKGTIAIDALLDMCREDTSFYEMLWPGEGACRKFHDRKKVTFNGNS